MEYLVTMTTHVPDGTAHDVVDDIRGRESARAHELALAGHLLRLWRPPLHPGEWRTLGLFAAADTGELQQVLASMPLSVWRTDEVTPLAQHPHDPGRGRVLPGRDGTEFLTTLTVTIPPGTPSEVVADVYSCEGARSRELAEQGRLLRLWRLPGERHALGHWQARDSEQLSGILASLPLAPWWTVETIPLTRHPSDPEIAGIAR
jgi:muconolactone delta-isomerase